VALESVFFSKIQPILSVFILFFCVFLKILRSRYHHPPPIQTATTVTTTVITIQQAAHFVKKKYQNLFFSSHIPKCYRESCIKVGFLPMCTCNSCNGERTHPNDTLSLINTQQPQVQRFYASIETTTSNNSSPHWILNNKQKKQQPRTHLMGRNALSAIGNGRETRTDQFLTFLLEKWSPFTNVNFDI